MAVDGQWRDGPAVGDWWGRALWGLSLLEFLLRTETRDLNQGAESTLAMLATAQQARRISELE